MDKPFRTLTKKYSTLCTYEDCTDGMYAKALCKFHYRRTLEGVDLEKPKKVNGQLNWLKNQDGYIYRYTAPDETGRRRQEKQHRVIMEEHLGRKLLFTENVHHINGVRDDNRIENLELWSSSQPSGQRVKDKVRWAREILDLYGEDWDNEEA